MAAISKHQKLNHKVLIHWIALRKHALVAIEQLEVGVVVFVVVVVAAAKEGSLWLKLKHLVAASTTTGRSSFICS